MVDKVTVGKSLSIVFRFSAVILCHIATDITPGPGLLQEQADLMSQFLGNQSKYHIFSHLIRTIFTVSAG